MLATPPIITIDGPSSSGKGTVCKAIARKLKWKLLDSGAIYRVLSLASLRYRINVESEEELVSIANSMDVHFIFDDVEIEIIFEGKNVTTEIRIQEIDNIASKLATLPRVREALLFRQREFCSMPGLIADGRDMGTVVFPNAPVKIFLDASLKERTRRRMLQLQKTKFNSNIRNLSNAIQERDSRDRSRAISPLIPANDAFMLNSTNMSIQQVVDTVLNHIHDKLKFV